MHVLRIEGRWLEPKPVSFGGEWRDLEPAFRPGSLELYFASDRPLAGDPQPEDFNLWRTHWEHGHWVAPVPVVGVNQSGNGSGDLYRIRLADAATPAAMSSPEPAEVVAEDPPERFPPIPGVLDTAEAYMEVYLGRDYPAMLPFMADNAVFTDPTSTIFGDPIHCEGAQTIVDWLTEVGTGVESVEFLIDRSFVSGEYAVFEGIYRTTGNGTWLDYPDLHMTLVHRGVTTIRVVEGKVVLHHDVIDYEEMWRQIELGIRSLTTED